MTYTIRTLNKKKFVAEGELSNGIFNPSDYDRLSDETKEALGQLLELGDFILDNIFDVSVIVGYSDEVYTEIEDYAIFKSYNDYKWELLALSEYTDQNISEIEVQESNYGPTSFVAGDEEYLVLEYDEAEELAKERAEELYDDVGLEGFTEWAMDHILDNFVDESWFEESMQEMSRNYAYDIQDEDADDEIYVNRLHQEIVELGLMDEPEWPEEDDFEDEEAFEEATENYKSELETEVEDLIDDFAEKRIEGEDPIEYYKNNFGDITDAVKEYDLIDLDALIDWEIETDGIAHFVATYDGEEHEIYLPQIDKTFYLYRI